MPFIIDLAEEMTPEQLAEYRASAPYRAMKKRDEGEYVKEQRKFLRLVLGVRWRWRCAYCADFLQHDRLLAQTQAYLPHLNAVPWSDEHVKPQSEGGAYRANNIVPACKRCNNHRKDRSVSEFLAEKGWAPDRIQLWHERQPFPEPIADLIDGCLEDIERGVRFTCDDVPLFQLIGMLDPSDHWDEESRKRCLGMISWMCAG